MKKVILTAVSVAVLAGCSTARSVEPIQQTVNTFESSNEGKCIIAVHRGAEANEKAHYLLDNAPNGMLRSADYAAAEQAANDAEMYRQEYTENCGPNLSEFKNELSDIYSKVQHMPGVVFNEGSAALTGESVTILEAVATRLVQNDANIEVAGHTSNTGSAEFNQTLSQQRAESVKDFLITQGVEAHRISAVGYGEDQPIATNDTKEGQQANKRVEIRYLK